MAKGNKRLRSVVEGAVEATREARRAAAAEKIRASVTTPEPAPAPPPKRTRARKPAVEPDTKLEATPEQRVFEPPTMSPDEGKRLRDTMLQSGRSEKPPAPKPSSGFAPVRGPGAVLGRLLKESYRQAPNIAANAVAIPAFTAAGLGGAYLGTAATLAAIRGMKGLFTPAPEPTPQERPPEPDDYRSGFRRAIEQRRRTKPGGTGIIRSLRNVEGQS
jgi:hypothetical protein